MKSIIPIVFFSFAIFGAFSQKENTTPDVIVVEGYCYEVINNLKSQLKNDSLAVSFFRDNYVITNKSDQKITNKKAKEVIRFYNQEKNKHLFCVYKPHYYENVLLKE